MYSYPSFVLLQDLNVTDIVLSSWWVNQLPSFSATQWYQAYSHHYEINILAAGGFIDPPVTFSGSGIYSNGTVLQSYFDNSTTLVNDTFVFHIFLVKQQISNETIFQVDVSNRFDCFNEIRVFGTNFLTEISHKAWFAKQIKYFVWQFIAN